MLNVKPYQQSGAGYCGLTSLRMILEYYQIEKTEEELADLSGFTPRRGISGEGLLEAAQFCGLEGKIHDYSTLEDLREMVAEKNTPVIINWFAYDDGHYSVVVDLDSKYVYFIDPEDGDIQMIRRGIFRRLWFDFPGDYLKKPEDLILRRMIVLYPEEKAKEYEDHFEENDLG